MSTGGTTSKIKPSRKVGAFFVFNSHTTLISALYFICRLPPRTEKWSGSSIDIALGKHKMPESFHELKQKIKRL